MNRRSKAKQDSAWCPLYRMNSQLQQYTWSQTINSSIVNFQKKIPPEAKTVLDIGCGDGRHMQFFLEKGYECVGIDFSHEALGLAERLFIESGYKKYKLINADISSYHPFSSFDVLISTKTFKHFFNRYEVISTFLKNLNPGGMFLFEFSSLNDSSYQKCKKFGVDKGDHKFIYNDIPYIFEEQQKIDEFMSKKCSSFSAKKITYQDAPHPGISDQPHLHETIIVEGIIA